MKILFIGGTGIISSACTQLAVDLGMDVFLLNRGQSLRPAHRGATVLKADIRDRNSVLNTIGNHYFDVVVNWIAFLPEHIESDIALLQGRTDQYIFISSASAYQKPLEQLPITEETPLENPFWQYSRDKIACEERLMQAYLQNGFPVTIVRPSHTYDRTMLPFTGRYNIVDRMRKGKKVIVHGDGTSLWVLTNHRDFAKGFTGLLGKPKTIGEAYHITSDELLTWNQIFHHVASAADTEADLIHIPSEFIARYDKDWGDGLLGDKSHSVIFDNSKIKQMVPEFKAEIPYREGAREVLTWFDEDPSRQVVDDKFAAVYDQIIADFMGR